MDAYVVVVGVPQQHLGLGAVPQGLVVVLAGWQPFLVACWVKGVLVLHPS